MYDAKVDFSAEGVTIDFESKVQGIHATAQEALINTAVTQGEDKVFPTRGTNLFNNTIKYGVVNFSEALHVSNFAATDTLIFNQTQNENSADMITGYELDPVDISNGNLVLNALITSRTGDSIGVKKTITLN